MKVIFSNNKYFCSIYSDLIIFAPLKMNAIVKISGKQYSVERH